MLDRLTLLTSGNEPKLAELFARADRIARHDIHRIASRADRHIRSYVTRWVAMQLALDVQRGAWRGSLYHDLWRY